MLILATPVGRMRYRSARLFVTACGVLIARRLTLPPPLLDDCA